MSFKERDNRGFEGIAYNAKDAVFYIANEKSPRSIIAIDDWRTHSGGLNIRVAEEIIIRDTYLDDYSDLYFNPQTGHLVFLSDESKQANEVSLTGKQISFMDLERGFSGLSGSIPQPEGITMDAEGKLYIVSEPNLLYFFEKP